jgi:hypothetical protein
MRLATPVVGQSEERSACPRSRSGATWSRTARFRAVGSGKPCVARSHRLAVDPDDEHATVPGHQCHFGEVRLERAEQFLGHPDGTGEPVALGAVLDAQPGLGRSAACGHGAKLAARPRDRPAGDRVGSDVLRCGGSGSGLLSPTFAQLSLQQHW